MSIATSPELIIILNGEESEEFRTGTHWMWGAVLIYCEKKIVLMPFIRPFSLPIGWIELKFQSHDIIESRLGTILGGHPSTNATINKVTNRNNLSCGSKRTHLSHCLPVSGRPLCQVAITHPSTEGTTNQHSSYCCYHGRGQLNKLIICTVIRILLLSVWWWWWSAQSPSSSFTTFEWLIVVIIVIISGCPIRRVGNGERRRLWWTDHLNATELQFEWTRELMLRPPVPRFFFFCLPFFRFATHEEVQSDVITAISDSQFLDQVNGVCVCRTRNIMRKWADNCEYMRIRTTLYYVC